MQAFEQLCMSISAFRNDTT